MSDTRLIAKGKLLMDLTNFRSLAARLIAAGMLVALASGCGESASESEAPPTAAIPAAVVDVPADGAMTVTVTEGTNMAIGLSPDDSRLVISLQGVLFTLPASGGAATALTDYYQDARGPDWSPDGASIAYYGYLTGNQVTFWSGIG